VSSPDSKTRTDAKPRPVGSHFDGDLRRALMDAAIATLAEVGADHLSLREVARRIGVSHAAPAHHFGDKAGLLTAIATEGFELFTAHLAGAVAESGAHPLDELAELGRAYAQFAETFPAHFEVMFRPTLIRADDPAFARAGDVAFAALRSHIARCQLEGWRVGADTDALTVAAWALAHGISVLRAQGSLARHAPDNSLAGVVTIANALLRPAS
jgi:AcrR family transcriptional regulator